MIQAAGNRRNFFGVAFCFRVACVLFFVFFTLWLYYSTRVSNEPSQKKHFLKIFAPE